MTAEHISQGSLFSTDFLQELIARAADWQLLTDAEIDAMAAMVATAGLLLVVIAMPETTPSSKGNLLTMHQLDLDVAQVR